MEASQPAGRREANVAPAPASTPTASVGWTPANPGPLGLAAFAATTFMLSMLNTNLVSEAGGLAGVLAVALAYGGIVQVFAGMWEFRTGNTFGAVAFSSYGAFWISYFVLVKITLGPTTTHAGVSLFLYAWAIFTLLMLVASLRTSGVLVVVFVLLTITFFLLAIGNAGLTGLQATNSTIKLGGWFGLATAAAAWYGALAGVANSTFGRDVVPTFPLNR
jgi:succinate-acetate transporter protein